MRCCQKPENYSGIDPEGRMRCLNSPANLMIGPDRASEPGLEIHFYKSRVFDPKIIPPKPEDSDSQSEELYEVRIIDNDRNTYAEVIQITMLALEVSEETAFAIAWEVDHNGSCVVAHASKREAERLASIIRLIGIEVQVNPINSRFC